MRVVLSTKKQTYDEGETLIAYHPRSHPEPSEFTALERFDASDPKRTYVKGRWTNTGLVRSTHWQNVCRPHDYEQPESEPQRAGALSKPMPQVDIHLRMPPALHSRLTQISEEQSTSLNQTIVLLLTSATAGFQFNHRVEDESLAFASN